MIAYLLIRHEPCYRRRSFERGLKALGYEIAGVPRAAPSRTDVLVIWNRYGHNDHLARRFEMVGARVLVAENGPLGRDFRGDHWYSLTQTFPLAGGIWPEGLPERWDSLGVEICEWRTGGKEIIILAQRGIGPVGIRQPDGWHQKIAQTLIQTGHRHVRIREHPGERPQRVTLEQDIENARCVVTWASGAAFKALLMGIPVFYGCDRWVGRYAADPLALALDTYTPVPTLTPTFPNRTPTFQKLAWSMWRTQEIETGLPFHHLLGSGSGA